MSNFVSGSGFIQATMLRICFGVVFVVLAVAAHTAQSEESHFAPDLDILTIQPVHTNGDILPYRFNASITLTRSAEAASSEFGNTPRLHIVAAPQKEVVWSTNSRWQVTPDSDRVSLSPVLRFESKGERVEIKPRRNSIWVGWRKTFP